MSKITKNQILFLLKVCKKEYLLYTIYNKEPFNVEISNLLKTKLGILTYEIIKEYNIDYVDGNIIVNQDKGIDKIRIILQDIGMRIPNIYRTVDLSLQYLLNFGYLYSQFSAPHNTDFTKWFEGNCYINYPSFEINDCYLNQYLYIHLRDLFTDFDIFSKFGNIIKDLDKSTDRLDLINKVVQYFQPSGLFCLSIDKHFASIIYTFKESSFYIPLDSIPKIVENGKIIINDQELNKIMLYQLAFIINPENVNYITCSDLIERIKPNLKNSYNYILSNINIMEKETNFKIRFSNLYSTFNQDLNSISP